MRLRLPSQILSALFCLAPNPIPAQTRANQAQEPVGTFAPPTYKSVGAAYAWSVLGTAVPLLLTEWTAGNVELTSSLVIGGLLVGPSMGQFYAGSPGGGMLGVGIRTGGAFVTFLGFASALDDVFCSETDEQICEEGDSDAAATLLILGTITYLGGAIYSLADAGRAVGRFNNRQANERVFGWSPTVASGPNGGLRTGALAWMRF